MRACATMFSLLSADPRGRKKVVERKTASMSLFDLLRSNDQGECFRALERGEGEGGGGCEHLI